MNDVRINIRIHRPSDDRPNGYIGASSSYPPDWSTGNDLADGPITDETMEHIVDDIRAVIDGHRNAYERDHHKTEKSA